MRNYLQITVCVLFIFSSCKTVNTTTKNQLFELAAFETGCKKENIHLVGKHKNTQRDTYTLSACGETITYKLIGDVYVQEYAANSRIRKIINDPLNKIHNAIYLDEDAE